METAPAQDEVSMLTREFHNKAHEYALAKVCGLWAQDAINVLDIILQNLQDGIDMRTDQLHIQQKALDEHRAALDQYRKIGIPHQAIIRSFKAAIESME